MSPRLFLQRVVEPGLALLPGYMVSDQARVILMAIAGQETNWAARAQANDGPGRGYWQFEPATVAGLATGARTAPLLLSVMSTLDLVGASPHAVIQWHDPMACVVARLLIWTDAAALPAVGDANGCWAYYTRLWRPGKPDRMRWLPCYDLARSTVTGRWT